MRANHVRYLLFRYQKTSDLLKKYRSFCYVFDSFSLLFPFLAQEQIAPIALHSRHSFLKSGGSDSLSWLFTKERPWAIHSQRSFTHKKQANFTLYVLCMGFLSYPQAERTAVSYLLACTGKNEHFRHLSFICNPFTGLRNCAYTSQKKGK